MSHSKHASKPKRPRKTVPVLGAAGLSLTLAGSASAVTGEPATDLPTPRNTALPHEIILGEEEISDVSLSTFYVFDKENTGAPRSGIQLARGGGCGCGHGGGCGGCGHGGGCGGGMRGCGGGCHVGGCGGGCVGRGWVGRGCGGGRFGGCGGCGFGGCGGCWGWSWGLGGCCLSWGGCALC